MGHFNLHSAVAKAALVTGETEIKVPAQSWGAASQTAFDSGLLDSDASACPASDAEGWYPLVYHCARGTWRGRMVRA